MTAGLPTKGGLSRQLANLTVDINAGAIDGTTVGSTTPTAGAFTTLSSTATTTAASLSVTNTANLNGIAATGAIALDGTRIATHASVVLSAGTDTNGMLATVTMLDNAGATVTGAHVFEFFFSEDANGQGLTTDTFSGDLTAKTGAILTALTAKKHVSAITATSGIGVLQIVDTNEPSDNYAVVKAPFGGKAIISNVSGTNWQ